MTMYYLAVVLPPELNDEVLVWKHEFRDQYGCLVGLKSPAHITVVAPFKMHPDKEAGLLQHVNQFGQRQHPFPLTTQGFSAFKPRTIFVALQPSNALNALKQELESLLAGTREYGIKKENRPFHPHITLATRDLQKADFFDAWPRFENMPYERTWLVTGISVLRHNGRSWDVRHTAPLATAENKES